MAKDLNYFKKKIMAILEKQTDDAPAEINKSLEQIDYIYSQMRKKPWLRYWNRKRMEGPQI